MLINLNTLIQKHKLNLKGVIHVGGHTFEERKLYDSLHLKQYWIEAIPELCVNFTEDEKHKLYNFAASYKEGIAKFYVTNNMASSSLLKLKDHLRFHPKIHETKEIVVTTKTIDSLNIKDANFINLDIQGAELLALKGATETLKNINYIYTEVNISEIYKNCVQMSELDAYLKDFTRVETELTKYNWGDAFYIRKK